MSYPEVVYHTYMSYMYMHMRIHGDQKGKSTERHMHKAMNTHIHTNAGSHGNESLHAHRWVTAHVIISAFTQYRHWTCMHDLWQVPVPREEIQGDETEWPRLDTYAYACIFTRNTPMYIYAHTCAGV
jgi:hypothetical protein